MSLRAKTRDDSSKQATFPQMLFRFRLMSILPGERNTDWDGAANRKGKEPAFIFSWVPVSDLDKSVKPGDRRTFEVVTGQVIGHSKAMLTRHVTEIIGRTLTHEEMENIDLLKLAGVERDLFICVDSDISGTTNRLAGIAQNFEAVDPKDYF